METIKAITLKTNKTKQNGTVKEPCRNRILLTCVDKSKYNNSDGRDSRRPYGVCHRLMEVIDKEGIEVNVS